jgi:hypothetical protein
MFATLIALFAMPAHATNVALDPQVRPHVGVSWVPGDAGLGVTGGFEARMTRLIAMDLGGVVSAQALPDTIATDGLPESARLRHGVYLTPGFRIPHPQPKSWAWELFVRGGGGVAWTTDVSAKVPDGEGTTYVVKPGMAGVTGADLLVRAGRFGARIAGKAWVFDATQASPARSFTIVAPQVSAEALIQW